MLQSERWTDSCFTLSLVSFRVMLPSTEKISENCSPCELELLSAIPFESFSVLTNGSWNVVQAECPLTTAWVFEEHDSDAARLEGGT